MSVQVVRCTNCGKRIAADERFCPNCGKEQPFRVSRIRCRYCRSRIPSNSALCPYCHHKPNKFYLQAPWLLWLIGGGGGLVLLACTLFNAPLLTSVLGTQAAPTAVANLPAAQALPSAASNGPTLAQVIYLTATPLADSNPTATLTETPLSGTGTATSTPTSRPTATATATATRRLPTSPPTRVPPTAVPEFPAPLLTSPQDGAVIGGSRKDVLLSFTSQAALPSDGWYLVQVEFKDREDRQSVWCGWTRDSWINFPRDYNDDSWQLDRTFRWHVRAVTSASDSPSTCAAPYIGLGQDSTARVFYWH